VNPLEADGTFQFNSGAGTVRHGSIAHVALQTDPFIPSLPGLIYAVQKDTLYINLYVSNKANVSLTIIWYRLNKGLIIHGKERLESESV